MNAHSQEPLLVVIVGPTASGKTALSIALAEHFGGEIVNCDSVAVYREVYIGTAKPSPEERQRAPHHLFDVVAPDQLFTAGEYARMARGTVNEIASRGKLPIVVGGTGLYLRAFLEGLFEGPQRSPELRERLARRAREHGVEYLHRILGRLDPQAAGKIHPNDEPKIIRAIEVSIAGQQPITEQWKRGRDPLTGFRIVRIGLDPLREQLYQRIEKRGDWMFANGLVEETQELLRRYPEDCTPLRAHSYKQCVELLRGRMTREEAVADAKRVQRHYAKRQMTWFRREPEVHWQHGFGDTSEVTDAVKVLINRAIRER